MLAYFYCIACSFIVSYACSYILCKNADKLKWGKKAYIERVKLHKKGVPRLGGIALYIAFFFTLFSMTLLDKSYFNLSAIKLLGIFTGATIILVTGVYDDLVRRLGYRIKFLSQILAIAIVIASGYNISIITNPLGGHIYVGVFGMFFVILFMLAIINAINLIDGLDGLACGISLIAVAGFFVIGLVQSQNFTLIITTSLIGAMLAFLKYNFYPAKLFLGDSGSLLLGFMIGIIAMESSVKRATAVSLIVPLLALLIPLASVIFTFSRRLVAAKHPFKPDKMHLHYRLIRAGISHKDTVLVFYTVAFLYVMLGVLCVLMPKRYEIGIIIFAGISIWWIYVWALHFINLKKRQKRKKHA